MGFGKGKLKAKNKKRGRVEILQSGDSSYTSISSRLSRANLSFLINLNIHFIVIRFIIFFLAIFSFFFYINSHVSSLFLCSSVTFNKLKFVWFICEVTLEGAEESEHPLAAERALMASIVTQEAFLGVFLYNATVAFLTSFVRNWFRTLTT